MFPSHCLIDCRYGARRRRPRLPLPIDRMTMSEIDSFGIFFGNICQSDGKSSIVSPWWGAFRRGDTGDQPSDRRPNTLLKFNSLIRKSLAPRARFELATLRLTVQFRPRHTPTKSYKSL